MVSRLLADMNLGLDWLDKQDTQIVVRNIGQLVRVFYVPDAKTTLDHQKRQIVPAQDFVAANNIKTVFGLGGSYINGTVITIILFTQEVIEKSQVEKFVPLMHIIKSATMRLVLEDKIFA